MRHFIEVENSSLRQIKFVNFDQATVSMRPASLSHQFDLGQLKFFEHELKKQQEGKKLETTADMTQIKESQSNEGPHIEKQALMKKAEDAKQHEEQNNLIGLSSNSEETKEQPAAKDEAAHQDESHESNSNKNASHHDEVKEPEEQNSVRLLGVDEKKQIDDNSGVALSTEVTDHQTEDKQPLLKEELPTHHDEVKHVETTNVDAA